MKKFLILLSSLFVLMLSVCAEESVYLPSQTGIVEKIVYIDADNDAIQAQQLLDIKILSGKFKNETIQVKNVMTGNPYYDIKLHRGTKVILHAEDNGNGVEYSIQDIKRSDTLLWLSLLFCGLLIYIGRKKGLYSLISIGLTVVLISNVLSPMILHGINPVLSAFFICILSTLLTMYLVGGINAKSTSASLGATLSIIFAGILSYIAINTAHLTGFSGENSLFLYSVHPELDFISITISTMILAALGAVMDVAMSISSTINEIHETDSNKNVKELFISGMNVGRDIIGTMANTLILVYMGGALALILLAGNIDIQKFINLNQVVTEIASALIGSIAIVICVPFTAITASLLIKKQADNSDIELK